MWGRLPTCLSQGQVRQPAPVKPLAGRARGSLYSSSATPRAPHAGNSGRSTGMIQFKARPLSSTLRLTAGLLAVTLLGAGFGSGAGPAPRVTAEGVKELQARFRAARAEADK